MSYRLLFLDKNGLLVGKAAVHCRRDEEAIAVARRYRCIAGYGRFPTGLNEATRIPNDRDASCIRR